MAKLNQWPSKKKKKEFELTLQLLLYLTNSYFKVWKVCIYWWRTRNCQIDIIYLQSVYAVKYILEAKSMKETLQGPKDIHLLLVVLEHNLSNSSCPNPHRIIFDSGISDQTSCIKPLEKNADWCTTTVAIAAVSKTLTE